MHPTNHRLARSLAALALAGSTAHATDLTIDGTAASLHRSIGTTITNTVTNAEPNSFVFLAADQDPGPTTVLGESVALGFSPAYVLFAVGQADAAGTFSSDVFLVPTPSIVGEQWFVLGADFDGSTFRFSNQVQLTLAEDRSRTNTPLAGEVVPMRPWFDHVRTFNEGTEVRVGVDPTLHPTVAGRTADVYVVAAKDAAAWDADGTLLDQSNDGPDEVTFAAGDLAGNTFAVDAGSLPSFDPDRIGVGYDVVVDLDRDGTLSPGDLIDGYGDEAGLYVVHDVTLPGPYTPVEATYSLGSFQGQNLFYPAEIDTLGQVPLIVVSHGNGHNYQWYQHLGDHMASYGYVVMSHQNNTVPGIETASTTTLINTDSFLASLATIQGGVLDGHVDGSRIVWIGHSRGGEGVARAYDRILDGQFTPTNYTADDIVLISSIAPTDFLGTNSANPHGANYHLWVGGSDSDVTGCADTNIVQSFHLHDRATNQRQSISLHGAGHGDFHAGTGGAFATGPCRIGRPATHAIMRGHFLPLVEYHVKGNLAAKDFLVRQWERFRPIGAPVVNDCVVVDLQFRDAVESGKLVLDDFQTGPDYQVASSGAAVSGTVTGYLEGALDDGNLNFTDFPNGTFNGMTAGSASDTTRGAIFTADGAADYDLTYTMVPATSDWSGYAALTFRACQITRHPLTIAELGDTTFEVRVTDADGTSSTLSIAAFGGGIEEPYQRTGCGAGTGWGNEFESVRMPLVAFREGLPELDLANVATLSFLFGPSHGTAGVRLGFDELELTTD